MIFHVWFNATMLEVDENMKLTNCAKDIYGAGRSDGVCERDV